ELPGSRAARLHVHRGVRGDGSRRLGKLDGHSIHRDHRRLHLDLSRVGERLPGIGASAMSMPNTSAVISLVGRVDPERLLQSAMALIEIPSPSGGETAVAERYAQLLRESGLQEVQIDRAFADSPSVIARVRGAG